MTDDLAALNPRRNGAIPRADQDGYALRSQARDDAAWHSPTPICVPRFSARPPWSFGDSSARIWLRRRYSCRSTIAGSTRSAGWRTTDYRSDDGMNTRILTWDARSGGEWRYVDRARR